MKKLLNLFVSMSFFPQMVQGPIARYPKLIEQVKELKGFDYQRFCMALQLMLWGYFKKLVIADRISVFVNQVFGNIGYYRGLIFVLALMASAVQLCRFSGCMDIVEGVAELFGINLIKTLIFHFLRRVRRSFGEDGTLRLVHGLKIAYFFPMSTAS